MQPGKRAAVLIAEVDGYLMRHLSSMDALEFAMAAIPVGTADEIAKVLSGIYEMPDGVPFKIANSEGDADIRKMESILNAGPVTVIFYWTDNSKTIANAYMARTVLAEFGGNTDPAWDAASVTDGSITYSMSIQRAENKRMLRV
jgi:hypothetical protein